MGKNIFIFHVTFFLLQDVIGETGCRRWLRMFRIEAAFLSRFVREHKQDREEETS